MSEIPKPPEFPTDDAVRNFTVRDLFAAAALHGDIASGKVDIPDLNILRTSAKGWYMVADAMMKAREGHESAPGVVEAAQREDSE